MRKFTLFLMSLFLSVGAMAQVVSGISKVPTEKTDPQSLETGYYLLKQANTQANTNDRSAGFIKANSIAVGSNLSTVGNAVNPAAADALNYLWHVTKNNDGTITIATANKEAYWPEPYKNERKLVGDSEKASLGIVTTQTTLGGHTATPTEGSAMLSNNKQDLAFIHYTNSGLGSWTDANPASVWFVEFYEVSVEDLNIEYAHNTGNINRDDRGLRAFTITDGENSLRVSDIQTTSTAPVYVDKSAQKFTTTAGSTLEFSEFNWDGWAMHAFAFIDYNKDYTFNSTANNNGEGNGEVVSYNYYNGNDITGKDNSNGNTQNQLTYGNSKGMPAFTLPADLEPGEYRLRVKIDWNSLDGNYGASDIATNGGCQCDITLVVEESAANSEAKAGLKAAIDELDAYLASIPLGNCITQYSSSIDSPEAQIEGIRNFYNEINSETSIETIEEYTAAVREIKESYKENVLEDGKFYHIRSVVYENGYVYASVTDKNPSDDRNERNGICWETTTTPSNAAIWKCEIIEGVTYFKSVYTASYMSGLLQYCPGILSETEKAPITLAALGDGQVNFLVDGTQAHAQTGNDDFFFVPWDGGKNTASAWYVEEATAGVQPHVLTVGNAGYATLMLGYNTVIPAIEGEECGVFTATVEGEYAVLNEIKGVLPANTAVIVKAAKGEYAFAYTTETATVENNVLRGTLYDEYITEASYVLGIVDGIVGLYTAAYNVSTDKTNDGTEEAPMVTYEAWKNNANKAYLPKTAGMNAASYSFRFGEGTTGVEEVKTENGNVKTVYDLTGRRVEAITAPGIYIVNGKKVLVK